ncbi:MAG: YkgJ family cysteine cluster protein [Alphaproteobacteria bacterium]|nr:YkgJ family cysteine cluster protein [Alphaproteobacteria bacterium]
MSLEAEIERQVALAAIETLAGQDRPRGFSDLFLLLEETAVGLIERHRAEFPPPTPLHCKDGCTPCCFTKHIVMTPPEALFLLDMIELCGFRLAVSQEAHSSRKGCPLLSKKGHCRFYAHRPLMCRAFHSLDVEACKKGVGVPGNEVPIWPPHFEIYTRMQAGLARGLMEKGLAMTKLDLRPVLALETPTALLWDIWLNGGDPFTTARMDQ